MNNNLGICGNLCADSKDVMLKKNMQHPIPPPLAPPKDATGAWRGHYSRHPVLHRDATGRRVVGGEDLGRHN